MRLGMLGGTFDPIHFGHLMMAEAARDRLGLDRVLIAPAGDPPHKQGLRISPARHRVAMVQRAIADNPHFEYDAVDVMREGPHYTVDTVQLVRERHGVSAKEFFFIIGGDSLKNLPSWHKPERLPNLCQLAIIERPEYQPNIEELEAIIPGLSRCLHWVQMPPLGLASSKIRRRVREGRSIRYHTPQTVCEYIAAHGLYREAEE